MKKAVLTTLMCFACVSMTLAQTKVKESRNVTSFNEIKISHGIDVEYIESNNIGVEVEADDRIANRVCVTVEGKTLVLSMTKGKNVHTNISTKVYVSAPYLKKIEAKNGSDFYAKKISSPNSLTLNSSQGSDISIENLEAKESVNINISQGSDCKIKSLIAKSCNAKASGGSDSDIYFHNVDHLVVNLHGGSDAKLGGNVNKLIVSASGASDVNIKNLKYGTIAETSSGASEIQK